MNCKEIIGHLRSLSNPANVAGMARYGINTHNTLGVPIPELRGLAKQLGRNHALALELWGSGIHEARILACLVDDPSKVTEVQLEQWVGDFDSWDVCDQCCANLFDRTPHAYRKAAEWSNREEEFVKRAGFVIMAALAVHDKGAPDRAFAAFLPLIRRESEDGRNFVRKAVNWALRQIGKRNAALNRMAIALAEDVLKDGSRSARWVASDALRELTAEGVRKRLQRPGTAETERPKRAGMPGGRA